MDAPKLNEFLDLFAIPPASCPGFPADLQHNHDLFKTWAEAATDAQRTALWVLLKRFILVGASVYLTATNDDRGLRIGTRASSAGDAEAVYARIRFPDDEEPWIDLYKSTIEKARFPQQLRVNLFAANGESLSPIVQDCARTLHRLVRQSDLIKHLLDDAGPYNHMEMRRRLAHRLPCSHPVGGLTAGSAAAVWRDAWKAAPVIAAPRRLAV
jgi:hypothetical protein